MATLMMKKIAKDLNKIRVLDEMELWWLTMPFCRLTFLVVTASFIFENPTSQRRMYRIYQNMKPLFISYCPSS